jgi:hypothetical protein
MLNKEEVPGKKQEGRSKKEIFSSSFTPPLSPSDTPPLSDHLPSAITDNLYA